jgi:hypothetical protein
MKLVTGCQMKPKPMSSPCSSVRLVSGRRVVATVADFSAPGCFDGQTYVCGFTTVAKPSDWP